MSGGGIEREREGAWEQGREGNFRGGSIFTNQPFTNGHAPPKRLVNVFLCAMNLCCYVL